MVTLTVVHLLKRWWPTRLTRDSVLSHDVPLRPMRFWPSMLLVLAAVLVGGAVGMWLLGVWSPIPHGVPDPERLRLDRIKTGLTVAAGLAAGVTLLMVLRRQSLSERAQRFAENEALEQRTTALYVAAADQLASDKAAVRLAGLYALERLGQDNPKLRQTVFDVWCAYLRMPYTPPLEVLRRNTKRSPTFPDPAAKVPEDKEEQRRQELEVRLTAQRLLATHLRGSDIDTGSRDSYWYTNAIARLSLDLTRAVLVDFDLSTCEPGKALLARAQFHGDANLNGAQFHGDANLSVVQFHGIANLNGAQFHGDAYLSGVQFHVFAHLIETQFHRDAYLNEAQFHVFADLGEAQFHGDAYLSGVQFHGLAYLGKAQFHGPANLSRAQFHGRANLSAAQFRSSVDLSGAQAVSSTGLPEGWAWSTEPANGFLRAIGRAGATTYSAESSQATRQAPNGPSDE